jgi:hypothetical protein
MEGSMDSGEWREVHARLIALAAQRAALDEEQGRLLLAALRAEVHARLGLGSFVEYVERLFGSAPRETGERLRVARALEELPETARALQEGRLCWSAVRELSRIVVPETEQAWLEAVEHKTVRQIERMVSGRAVGDRPEDPPKDEARTHVLRFEVSAETYATWREAVGLLREQAGGGLDEDAALLAMARQILAGPGDEGRASYQIAMTVCRGCGQGFQEARGEEVAVDDAVVEMASCDAQHIGELPCCETQGAHPGADASPHVGSTSLVGRGKRAAQSIPPATRRFVMRRERGRCIVPGCRCAVFLDVHHLKARAEGGDHDPDRLVLLCAAHHRAVHLGLLIIEGTVSSGLRFFHADGRRYGALPPDGAAIDAASQAFVALRHLGFKESESRRALAQVRSHVGANVEALVRGALAALTP